MRNPFRRRTLFERVSDSVGLGLKHVDRTAVRSGLVVVGVVAATAAASAVVSSVREKQQGQGASG